MCIKRRFENWKQSYAGKQFSRQIDINLNKNMV